MPTTSMPQIRRGEGRGPHRSSNHRRANNWMDGRAGRTRESGGTRVGRRFGATRGTRHHDGMLELPMRIHGGEGAMSRTVRLACGEDALEDAQGDASLVNHRPNNMLARELVTTLTYQLTVVGRVGRKAKRAVIVTLTQIQVWRGAEEKVRRRLHWVRPVV